MNKAILIGRLTADPKANTTGSGIEVSTFTLAIDREYKNADGERQADFINIVAWRKLAEICNKYLAKGRQCAVVGTIQTRSYDADDGSKRYVTEVVADSMEMLGSKNDNAGGGSFERETPAAKPQPKKAFDKLEPIEDDGLPF